MATPDNVFNFGIDKVRLKFDGVIESEDEEYVQSLVDEAVRILLADCQGLRTRVESGKVDKDLVEDAVKDAVLRVLREDEPTLKSESEDGYSYTKNALATSPDIWITDKWLKRLGCEGNAEAGPRSARARVRSGWLMP